MAKQVVLRMAEQLQFDVRGISVDSDAPLVEAIATVNSLSSQMVIQQLRPSLEQTVFVNRRMAKDFRVSDHVEQPAIEYWNFGRFVAELREAGFHDRYIDLLQESLRVWENGFRGPLIP